MTRDFAAKLVRADAPCQTAATAGGGQRVDAVLVETSQRLPLYALLSELGQAGRLEDRTAPPDDAAHIPGLNPVDVAVDQPFVPMLDAVHLHAIVDAGAHDRTDGSVHTRRVAAAGDNPESSNGLLHRGFPIDNGSATF